MENYLCPARLCFLWLAIEQHTNTAYRITGPTSDMAALVTERVLQTRGWWGVDRWVGAVYSSVPEAALAPLLATW